jgi:hypothetical protein
MGLESYPPPLEAALVPVIWTSLAVGMPFFIYTSTELYGFRSALVIAACAALPFTGITAYWAFFAQRLFLAWFLTALIVLPALSTLALAFIKAEKRG